MSYYEHGGRRPGAGRKKDWIADFGVERRPHSIYCSDGETDDIRTFLYRKRAIRIMQNYEPSSSDSDPNPNRYAGTHEEWERDYNSIRYMDLEHIDDMENRVEAILKKCLRDDE